MATKIYRFQQTGISAKNIFADVSISPVAIDAYGQSWMDVEIDESQFNLLVQSMRSYGYEYYETNPRIDIDVFAASILGAVETLYLSDDDTKIVVLETDVSASKALRTIIVDYSYFLPVSNKKQMGRLLITHDGVDASFDQLFSEVEGYEIPGLSFDIDISSSALRLKIITSSIGEAPTEFIIKRFGNYGGVWNTVYHYSTTTPISSDLIFTTDIKTGNCTADNNYIVRCNPSGGSFTVYAPTSPSVGTRFGVKNTSSSTNSIVIDGNGKNLDGLSSRTSSYAYQWRVWQYDGTQWLEVDAGEFDMTFTSLKTGNYTALANQYVLSDPTAGGFQVKAPASPTKDQRFGVKNNSSSANLISINGNGNFIDDSVSLNMNQAWQWRVFQYDGTQWRELSGAGKALTFTSVKTSLYTAAALQLVLFDPTGGGFTIKAPASPSSGDEFGVKNYTNNTNVVTVDGNGKNLDGSATRSMTQAYEWRTWKYNGTQWNEIGD